MASINVSKKTKARFDDLNSDDFDTHDEFASHLLDVFEAFEGEPVDHEKLADNLSKRLVPSIENAAYRGVDDYGEWNDVVLVPRDAVDSDALEARRVPSDD
jgi:hypothetical protein